MAPAHPAAMRALLAFRTVVPFVALARIFIPLDDRLAHPETAMQPKQTFEELKQEISARHAKLSRRLRQIAEFAIAQPDHTALETVASIAAKAHVPPSSLIRFAKHFGYDGFTDMQRVFRSRLIARASSYNQRIREFRSGQPADMRSPLGVLRHFVEADAAALQRLGHET